MNWPAPRKAKVDQVHNVPTLEWEETDPDSNRVWVWEHFHADSYEGFVSSVCCPTERYYRMLHTLGLVEWNAVTLVYRVLRASDGRWKLFVGCRLEAITTTALEAKSLAEQDARDWYLYIKSKNPNPSSRPEMRRVGGE